MVKLMKASPFNQYNIWNDAHNITLTIGLKFKYIIYEAAFSIINWYYVFSKDAFDQVWFDVDFHLNLIRSLLASVYFFTGQQKRNDI